MHYFNSKIIITRTLTAEMVEVYIRKVSRPVELE